MRRPTDPERFEWLLANWNRLHYLEDGRVRRASEAVEETISSGGDPRTLIDQLGTEQTLARAQESLEQVLTLAMLSACELEQDRKRFEFLLANWTETLYDMLRDGIDRGGNPRVLIDRLMAEMADG